MAVRSVVTRFFFMLVAVPNATVAFGQDYPSKAIRIITSPAGGGNDFASRLIGPGLSSSLGQPVVVDNRPTVLAVEAVSKAPPDGYTLHVAGSSLWVSTLLRKMPYDAVRDFAPISQLTREINVFVVHPSVPVKSIRELVALAKKRPGELNYALAVVGSPAHLGLELFKTMAGVNIVHVPYKGTAAMITAVLSGEAQMTINDVGVVAPHVKAGKLRALAVTSTEPSALAPGIPTVSATGVPGYELTGVTGVWAPARTPAAIIGRLNREIVRIVNLPDIKEKFVSNGLEVVGSTPEQFSAVINADIAKMGKVIKDANIKVD